MQVEVKFTLDVDPAAWAGEDADEMTTAQVRDEVQRHAESVVRDLFYDQGWIADTAQQHSERQAALG